jgi:hypothetical protein
MFTVVVPVIVAVVQAGLGHPNDPANENTTAALDAKGANGFRMIPFRRPF